METAPPATSHHSPQGEGDLLTAGGMGLASFTSATPGAEDVALAKTSDANLDGDVGHAVASAREQTQLVEHGLEPDT